MDNIWNTIVGRDAPPFNEWGKYFVDKYPEYFKDIDLIQRFNHPEVKHNATSRGGIVFFTTAEGKDIPAGLIVANEDGKSAFLYHKDYVKSDYPPISRNIPKTEEPVDLFAQSDYFSWMSRPDEKPNLGSFISNRGAEGWKSYLQAISLHQVPAGDFNELLSDESSAKQLNTPQSALSRLLTFGRDIPGAFSIIDIDRDPEIAKQHDQISRAAVEGRATVAGAQPKLLGIRTKDGRYRATVFNDVTRLTEDSDHILKLGIENNRPVIIAEYLAMQATRALEPKDEVAVGNIVSVDLRDGKTVPALALQRFDRTPGGGRRHFTEMTELLSLQSKEKFDGSYSDMARAINPRQHLEGPQYEEVKKLYKRVVMGFLVGNMDNHMKNFAVYDDTQKLTPNYDIEATELFGFKKARLKIKGEYKHSSDLDAKVMAQLGVEMGVAFSDMRTVFEQLKQNIPAAIAEVKSTRVSNEHLDEEKEIAPMRGMLADLISRRWEKFKDYDKAIGDMSEQYAVKARRGRDIPRELQRIIYAQFAPERLPGLEETAAKPRGGRGR